MHHRVGHPEPMRRPRSEVAVALQQGSDAIEGGVELPFLDAVLKEAMRLTPVAPAVDRTLRTPLELGGYRIPAGVHLWPAVYLLHHDPGIFDHPEQFRPERFLGSQAGAGEFLPFGGGRRRCLGAAFATLEMRTVLAELLRRHDLRLLRPRATKPIFRGFTVVPSSGVPALVVGGDPLRKLR